MLPVNCGSHSDYQNFVTKNLRKYYPDPNALARSTWDIIERFWNLDLSETDVILADKYSKFGPAPRTPSCMQRSYLLSIDFKITSLTEWAAQLKINPLYAILSGFEVGNTPGVGTFYDFINRCLWDSDDSHLSSHIHPLKTKVKKPKSKGTKADSVEKVTVAELLPELENTQFHLDDQPYASLFKIYKKEFLDITVDKGLIHSNSLALARDGTPVVTSHRERKKRICNCREKGITDCKCDNPCYDAKYGRTVHLVMNDNPRLFNNPPRSSKEWKLEFNARTSAERSNKREKLDFKLEDGRHRSTKMWYCRLYHILMLQHLDAWDLPSESPLKKMILDVA